MYFQGKKTLCKAQNPSMEVEKLSDLEIKQPPDPALSASCRHFQGTFWLNPPLRSSSICLCIWSIHYECLIKKTKTLMISCCSLCYTVSPLLVNIHYIQQQNIKMILIKKWFKACYWSQEENELWRNLKIKKHLVRHTTLQPQRHENMTSEYFRNVSSQWHHWLCRASCSKKVTNLLISQRLWVSFYIRQLSGDEYTQRKDSNAFHNLPEIDKNA